MGSSKNRHFFTLTSLQIGDLQSYLSDLTLFLAPDSNKILILVDNRPWLVDHDSRPAHLWQFMVTKSRLSPFANSRARKERKDFKKRFNVSNSSRLKISNSKKLNRWFSLIDDALHQRKALLPVRKLRDSILLNSDLHHTLYGFIVFEVEWNHVRGINYLNELQTDTSMALEAKLMKRWEFDSIEQAAAFVHSWFAGTYNESLLLKGYLDDISVKGEVYYDAQEDFSAVNLSNSGVHMASDYDSFGTISLSDDCSDFGFPSDGAQYQSSLLHTPPPPSGPYKRRKIMQQNSSRSEYGDYEETYDKVVSSPTHTTMSTSIDNIDNGSASLLFEPTHYGDVLLLFRFNDCDLPFKLKHIIMHDLRLLTLLEYGLPSWVIFLQSYPVFCHFYRPWMCPLARILYVLISVVTVLIGFYDLYKNVPLLKATASRLCGPLLDWIETWEMISRIKYLGTMLFLHNFEKALKWFLMTTHAIRSLLSVITEPLAGPLGELLELFLPICNVCFHVGEQLSSVFLAVVGFTCSSVANMTNIFLWPAWLILSTIWNIASSILLPIIYFLWEISVTPIRLVFALAKLIVMLSSYIFYLLRDTWSLLSTMFNLASASEAAVGTHEISMWRSLFSQIFRAIRSILYGFVAFFATCNRHRLSMYNHMQKFVQRLSCATHSTRFMNFIYGRQKQRPLCSMEDREYIYGKSHKENKTKKR
ncbi:hypothetical protein QJS10_CPA05g01094 [Acorus calamus]|uniref:Uncharacterized protein n=1 Tax=Acorus calamus TaxID=4465 RepID=A0AAV9ETP1_ACOCL|nr:hypothetical protein QJS10_CPA05g01094 [Acorus calamus]